jgi:hypothetical protein
MVRTPLICGETDNALIPAHQSAAGNGKLLALTWFVPHLPLNLSADVAARTERSVISLIGAL